MEKQKRKHRVIKQTEINVVLLQQKEKKKKMHLPWVEPELRVRLDWGGKEEEWGGVEWSLLKIC